MRELRDIRGVRPSDLSGRQRLPVRFSVFVVTVVLFFTVVYYVGIHRLEGRDYSVFRALQTVVETFTTTGYGEGGSTAVDALPDGASVTTVNADPATDPDIVGDVTEPETLAVADIEDAATLVATVDGDATALLTVALARSPTTWRSSFA